MTFRVRIDPVALRQIEQFAAYLRDYSEEFAIEQIERLDRILSVNLRASPLTWPYFAFTGAPYRAYLFRVGRQTQYWNPCLRNVLSRRTRIRSADRARR